MGFIDQNRWLICLKKQNRICDCQFPIEIVIQCNKRSVLFLRHVFEHRGFPYLACADNQHGFEKLTRFCKLSFQFTMYIIHAILQIKR